MNKIKYEPEQFPELINKINYLSNLYAMLYKIQNKNSSEQANKDFFERNCQMIVDELKAMGVKSVGKNYAFFTNTDQEWLWAKVAPTFVIQMVDMKIIQTVDLTSNLNPYPTSDLKQLVLKLEEIFSEHNLILDTCIGVVDPSHDEMHIKFFKHFNKEVHELKVSLISDREVLILLKNKRYVVWNMAHPMRLQFVDFNPIRPELAYREAFYVNELQEGQEIQGDTLIYFR